ncbi:MAG: hypothetical protein CL923_11300 [Deltaproteobacteria bacterium]|jgi:UDP-N-acetylmuramoyl-tripeptide--D-alanyl-D-alanine ligase|nr:hypothetical protein [Deltaproteobacteria bacterium]MDP7158693.1 UDP-N-acetylmuramoyl-tripeptide--D-alanyl-D-alanine ligase [SAR324 cluster bacterium]MDP7463413.1 UDP-N-acetylmuramoyl-tripeptide--D-alanyl-D-alanine ligase [SAR324 cluster bacterium]MDP7630704.1 UDP-N-acetylmuramoyl-tripeptide--D-alanyl-D-alanine ligase [SAR324 cluster bacterium]
MKLAGPILAKELAEAVRGTLVNASGTEWVSSLSHDSRTLEPGDWFLALRGESFDGHDFIGQVLSQKPAGVILNPERFPNRELPADLPCLTVCDPNQALLDWGKLLRNRFTGQVLAITGSNGKTTTKDLLGGLCRFQNCNSFATKGNLNNLIGVPLSLLDAPLHAPWWVVELGTNQFGEIKKLSCTVRPAGGILTNIGESHLEFLESTAGVAREKSGMFAGMAPESVVVSHFKTLHLDVLEQHAAGHRVRLLKWCWEDEPAPPGVEVVTLISRDETGSQFRCRGTEFFSPIHNPLQLQNLVGPLLLLAEQGVALATLREAVTELQVSPSGRFQIREQSNWTLIDDTYNANPSSFQAVAESAAAMYPGRRKIAVVGRMAELGVNSPELHRQVGAMLAASGFEQLLAFGEDDSRYYAEGWRTVQNFPGVPCQFVTLDALVAAFPQLQNPGDVVLVKGSRSAGMERFVQQVAEP